MFDDLIAVASALGLGAASAVMPLVNAEAVAAVIAAISPMPLAVICGIALGAGQTAGKVVIYEAARAGRRRLAAHVGPPDRPPGRMARAGAKLLALLDGRWQCVGIVLLSAVVGLPPLLATAVAAGAVQMRRLDFVLCCLLGRSARFVALIVPIVAART